jgi:hypothetical protein
MRHPQAKQNPVFKGGLQFTLTLAQPATKSNHTLASRNMTGVAAVFELVV